MTEFSTAMKKGDTFTIQGQYRRRGLWQWLTRQPLSLQVFRVTEDATAFLGGITPYEATNQIEGEST